MIPPEHIGQLPRRIQDRLGQLHQEVDAIIAKANTHFKTEVPRRIAFNMTNNSTSGDLITGYERAQSVSFVTRYEHLPDNLTVLQHSDATLSRRYLSDYASGELNYLLWKHVRVLGFIKSLLGPIS